MIRKPLTSLALVLSALSFPALAQVTYNYAGAPYTSFSGAPYDGNAHVSGSFQVASALPPGATTDISASLIGFSLTDGVATRTQANSQVCAFSITTDGAGNIVDWNIMLRQTGADPQHLLESFGMGTDNSGLVTPPVTNCGPAAPFPFGNVTGTPGTWSPAPAAAVAAVPALSPLSAMLIALGLFGSAALGRRNRA